MKMKKGLLMTALITGTLMSSAAAFAEELQEYTLDPMVITAQRMEKKDLDTPAAVDVIPREQIEKTGGASAFEVLRQSIGLSVTSQGPNGVSYGSMTSDATIRGVDRGTLVLLDGMPLNQDGKYNLEDIPTDIIEKVEIVRSGGSVMYGSEASGGVINIITRKNIGNKIKVSAGDMGRQSYSLTVGEEGFSAVAYLYKRGKINRTSTTASSGMETMKVLKYYRYDDGERKGIRWNYKINDNLTFTHAYGENENNISQIHPNAAKYNHGVYQENKYKNTDNSFLLNFNDLNGLKILASYGTQEKSYDKSQWKSNGKLSSSGLYSWRKGHNTNLEVQKSFDVGNNKLLVGASYKKEDMDIFSSKELKDGKISLGKNANYSRDIYSIYASYNWVLSDSDTLDINVRETFARNCDAKYEKKDVASKNLNKFTPEIQYIKKLNDDSSVYTKVGKSFRLPELTRIYGSSVILSANELKPEQGTHYEIGYKLNSGKTAWRAALYKYDIKDSIESTGSAANETLRYYNADVKSYGVELTCDIQHDDYFSSSFGIAVSNPKQKDNKGNFYKYGDRLQLNAGVNYNRDKLATSLMANYYGKRLDDDIKEHAECKVKPALYTDFHMSYAPEKNQKLFLHVNNIFDREDLTTNQVPTPDRLGYISVGRNFMVGYEYSF